MTKPGKRAIAIPGTLREPATTSSSARRHRGAVEAPVVLTREDAYDGATVPLIQYRLESPLLSPVHALGTQELSPPRQQVKASSLR